MSILGNIEDYIKSNIEDYKEQLAIANDDNKYALEIINTLERQKAVIAMKLIRHESIRASDIAPAFGDIESATDQDGNKYTEVEYSSSKVKKFKQIEVEVWEEFLDLSKSMGKNSSIAMGTNYIAYPDKK